eukprot:4149646-Prymnesium_polylepis.1
MVERRSSVQARREEELHPARFWQGPCVGVPQRSVAVITPKFVFRLQYGQIFRIRLNDLLKIVVSLSEHCVVFCEDTVKYSHVRRTGPLVSVSGAECDSVCGHHGGRRRRLHGRHWRRPGREQRPFIHLTEADLPHVCRLSAPRARASDGHPPLPAPRAGVP